MFEAGVLLDDLPAVYVDPDTVVLGDLGQGDAMMSRRDSILMLQSAIIPFGPLGRWAKRLSGGRQQRLKPSESGASSYPMRVFRRDGAARDHQGL